MEEGKERCVLLWTPSHSVRQLKERVAFLAAFTAFSLGNHGAIFYSFLFLKAQQGQWTKRKRDMGLARGRRKLLFQSKFYVQLGNCDEPLIKMFLLTMENLWHACVCVCKLPYFNVCVLDIFWRSHPSILLSFLQNGLWSDLQSGGSSDSAIIYTKVTLHLTQMRWWMWHA